jgi:hypothetical protein
VSHLEIKFPGLIHWRTYLKVIGLTQVKMEVYKYMTTIFYLLFSRVRNLYYPHLLICIPLQINNDRFLMLYFHENHVCVIGSICFTSFYDFCYLSLEQFLHCGIFVFFNSERNMFKCWCCSKRKKFPHYIQIYWCISLFVMFS